MMYDEETVRKIIKESVHETLTGLGFNLGNLYEVQADMQYLHKLRRNHEDMASRIRFSVISVTIPAVIYCIWNAFKKVISD